MTGRPLTVFWIKINCYCQYVQPAVRTNQSLIFCKSDQWGPSVPTCSADRSKILFLHWASLPESARLCLECRCFVNDLHRLKCWIMSLTPQQNFKQNSRSDFKFYILSFYKLLKGPNSYFRNKIIVSCWIYQKGRSSIGCWARNRLTNFGEQSIV